MIGCRNQPAELGAGIAARELHDPELGKDRAERLAATTLAEPGILLAGGQSEGDAGVEGERRILAEVVVGGGVPGMHRSLLDGIHHLEPRHQLAGWVGADGEPAAGELADAFGKPLDRPKNDIEAPREARGQTPGHFGAGEDLAANGGPHFGAPAAGQRSGSGDAQGRVLEERAAFHGHGVVILGLGEVERRGAPPRPRTISSAAESGNEARPHDAFKRSGRR